MLNQKKRNILIVVLDQFRYDYVDHLVKTRNNLKFLYKCDANSMPTMTETMHANISTGQYPSKHGIISDSTFDNYTRQKLNFPQMYAFFSSLVNRGMLNLVSKIVHELGYSVCCIGGKPKSVQLLCSLEDCVIRISRDPEKGEADIESPANYEHIRKSISDLIRKNNLLYFSGKFVKTPSFDRWIIDLAFLVFGSYIKNSSPWFFLITLPALDYIGHKYGPGSSECLQAVNIIDGLLDNLFTVTSIYNPFFIVIGDHGCRSINVAIMLDNEASPQKFIVYKKRTSQFEFMKYIPIDRSVRDDINHIQLDGGLIRIWIKDLNKVGRISKWVSAPECLGTYVRKIPSDKKGDSSKIMRNSVHNNLGNLYLTAKKSVAFLRRGWYEGHSKLLEKKPLLLSEEVPLGEHGSIFMEDRQVPLLLSDNPLKLQKIRNVDILRIIKKIII